MKKLTHLLRFVFVLLLCFGLLSGCNRKIEQRWPVFDKTQFGMTEAEVRKAEGLSQDQFTLDTSQSESGLTAYRVKQTVFGTDAEVVYLFNTADDLGLVSVQIVFPELSGSAKDHFDALTTKTNDFSAEQLAPEEQKLFIPVMTERLNQAAKGANTFTEESISQKTLVQVYPNYSENRLTYDGVFAAWLAKLTHEG